jgi:hypothetical protein
MVVQAANQVARDIAIDSDRAQLVPTEAKMLKCKCELGSA